MVGVLRLQKIVVVLRLAKFERRCYSWRKRRGRRPSKFNIERRGGGVGDGADGDVSVPGCGARLLVLLRSKPVGVKEGVEVVDNDINDSTSGAVANKGAGD